MSTKSTRWKQIIATSLTVTHAKIDLIPDSVVKSMGKVVTRPMGEAKKERFMKLITKVHGA